MDKQDSQTQSGQLVRALQEELSNLKVLRGHAGFGWLLRLGEEQLELRKRALFLTPLRAIDETLEQEFKKGEIAGITLFLEMVDIRVGVIEQELQEYFKEIGDGTERAGYFDGGAEFDFSDEYGIEDRAP